MGELDDLRAQKDVAYKERDKCLALAARLAQSAGYICGIGKHQPEDEPGWEGWTNVVFMELGGKQLSWHIHDSELSMFDFLPRVKWKWDGHTTGEKYERLLGWIH